MGLKSSLALPVFLDDLVGKGLSPASIAWIKLMRLPTSHSSRDTLQRPVSNKNIEKP